MLFTIVCQDRPDHLPVRMKTRPDHLAYLNQFAASLVVAGPMLDGAGQPCGSTFVVDMADLPAVEAFLAGDPYAKADLFSETTIRGFRMVFKDGAPV